MKPSRTPQGCGGGSGGGGSELARRDFLKASGLAAGGALSFGWIPGAAAAADVPHARLVPADKQLPPEWVKSLLARGQRETYRGAELEKIGMPVGGICCGTIYLGGDGRLWHWDIFNRVYDAGSSGPHYARPLTPSSPLSQGFALRVTAGGQVLTRLMDATGWKDIAFTGEYPLGLVEYRDPEMPVRVTLEAFSPFVPLDAEDSALPVTVMQFTVKNIGAEYLEAELAGWLENAVCLHSARPGYVQRRNTVHRETGLHFLECGAERAPVAPAGTERPDILFEDFEKETYEGWTVEGAAFGSGPVEAAKMPSYQGDVGAHGRRLVNSHHTRRGEDVAAGDAHVGRLLSPTFAIERNYINFLVGGGAHQGRTCLNLLMDGKAVLSATGASANRLQAHCFDVRRYAGQRAQLEIIDNEKGGWGNVGVDYIVFSDKPPRPTVELQEQPDYGTMGLGLLKPEPGDRAVASLEEWGNSSALFAPGDAPVSTTQSKPVPEKLAGLLSRKLKLPPGAAATVAFLVTWHFPRLAFRELGECGGRHYGKRFADARAVARYVADRFQRLGDQTKLWHDTWYDSTLPHWFLDRTFSNTSILASSTCYWFANGRFYAFEGIGCCAGTCTHVWHYAHAMARLFPPLERSLREMVDFGAGFEPATGRIRFRAEYNNHWAVDGQAGCILRTYREHQISRDEAFLRRVWPRVKPALEFLINRDGNADGVIEGAQHNTLDADWQGQISWLSGLYLAALRAGEEMAREMGDSSFAAQCRSIFEVGRKRVDETLFNGEYYIQLPDQQQPNTVGAYGGCLIDQVFGQSWAWQVGLGRIHEEAQTKSALRSLWRYNFAPDVGPYRAVHKAGRWYAMPGEGGLLMLTFPKGRPVDFAQNEHVWTAGYFNECMTGFEYQVAGHMLAEGMLTEGLAVARAIHDRYHPRRRNPWNEIECSDHYARAMASYGVFLAVCGYEYHGPKGRLGFAPRLAPDNFRAAFTAAEGWGTFAQQREGATQRDLLQVKWGRLRLRTLSFAAPDSGAPGTVKVLLRGQAVPASFVTHDRQVVITLAAEATLEASDSLEVTLT